MWKRQDDAGNVFMSGTMNGLRLLLVPNGGQDDGTDADYLLLVAQNQGVRKPRKE